MNPGTFIDQMTAWRLLKHRYMNFYELHGFPASWHQWSGLGQMTGGSVQWCSWVVRSPGPGLWYPQDSPEVTWFIFYLDSLWSPCSWSSSVNSLFSSVTGMGRKYMPGDSFWQIPLFLTYCWYSQSAAVVGTIWTLLDKFEPSWFSKGCMCSLDIYFQWKCKSCWKFFLFVFGTEDSSISETVN